MEYAFPVLLNHDFNLFDWTKKFMTKLYIHISIWYDDCNLGSVVIPFCEIALNAEIIPITLKKLYGYYKGIHKIQKNEFYPCSWPSNVFSVMEIRSLEKWRWQFNSIERTIPREFREQSMYMTLRFSGEQCSTSTKTYHGSDTRWTATITLFHVSVCLPFCFSVCRPHSIVILSGENSKWTGLYTESGRKLWLF